MGVFTTTGKVLGSLILWPIIIGLILLVSCAVCLKS
jgi:hypothetical protein